MQQGRGVDIGRQGAVAEAVKLFVLPPLLTFALVAFSLLLFTSHLAHKDLRTNFIFGTAQDACGSTLGPEGALARTPLAVPRPR